MLANNIVIILDRQLSLTYKVKSCTVNNIWINPQSHIIISYCSLAMRDQKCFWISEDVLFKIYWLNNE